LWASLTDARGVDGRDALWAHPDMLPTASDLDDPDGFVHREQLDFSELDKMLGEAAQEPDLHKKDVQEAGDQEKGDDTE
uniref:zinc-dependent metalloprotease n=1 Tax=Streptomyces shenzhenensis TaxID=943815 RepID=UPI0015F09875